VLRNEDECVLTDLEFVCVIFGLRESTISALSGNKGGIKKSLNNIKKLLRKKLRAIRDQMKKGWSWNQCLVRTAANE
jgi:hypothetical protein